MAVLKTSPRWASSGTLRTAVSLAGAALALWSSVFAATSFRATVRQNSSVSVISVRRIKPSSKSLTTARYHQMCIVYDLAHYEGHLNLNWCP